MERARDVLGPDQPSDHLTEPGVASFRGYEARVERSERHALVGASFSVHNGLITYTVPYAALLAAVAVLEG